MLAAERFQQLLTLYADYAAVLDAAQWERWPEFFTADCRYRIQPRENFDQGLPLCTMAFESQGMLRDRVYGISHTLFHEPYYQRHVIGVPRVLRADEAVIEAECNYAVFRTKPSQPSEVFNVGRTLDTVRITADGLRFEDRLVIFDSELIANSLIYPL